MLALGLAFQVLLMFDQNMYIQNKNFELSSFEILPLIAFKLGRLYTLRFYSFFYTAASTESKRFMLKSFVFSLGSFLLFTVSKFLTMSLKKLLNVLATYVIYS